MTVQRVGSVVHMHSPTPQESRYPRESVPSARLGVAPQCPQQERMIALGELTLQRKAQHSSSVVVIFCAISVCHVLHDFTAFCVCAAPPDATSSGARYGYYSTC